MDKIKKAEFDELIKQNIKDAVGCDVFGYKLPETKAEPYGNYYSNDAFASFIDEMKSPAYQEIYRAYSEGKGSELVVKNGKYGKMPPKMASVASSSRFCYLALRDGAQGLGGSGIVKFEQECKIDGLPGNAPQLDAYIPNENIYVEAKCHEIFDSHKIQMKEKYWDLLYGKDNCFGLDITEKPIGESFESPLSVFDIEKTSSMFDLKQLICHLLGIASQKREAEPATLVYLFFKPKAKTEQDAKKIDEVFEVLQDEIKKIFASAPIRHFTARNQIQLRAVAEYSEIMEPLNSNNIVTIA